MWTQQAEISQDLLLVLSTMNYGFTWKKWQSKLLHVYPYTSKSWIESSKTMGLDISVHILDQTLCKYYQSFSRILRFLRKWSPKRLYMLSAKPFLTFFVIERTFTSLFIYFTKMLHIRFLTFQNFLPNFEQPKRSMHYFCIDITCR